MTAVDASPHPADTHDTIQVRGARVNNLRDVDVDLPKRRLTVVTGVSGSGKSSLVFGTIAAESRRLINETYSSFVQAFMPTAARPDVDHLHGLTAAIVIDQERMGQNPRSTVGTATDALAWLRVIFSRLSTPHVGPSAAFSFNTASASGQGAVTVQKGPGKPTKEVKRFQVLGGMCPDCEGMGTQAAIDEDVVVDRSKSLAEGAILLPGYPPDSWGWKAYAENGRLDPGKRLSDYTAEEWDWLMHAEPTKVKVAGINMTYLGLVPRIRQTLFGERPPKQAHMIAFKDKVATTGPCPACGGTRLNEPARTATVRGTTLPECCDWEISDLLAWVEALDEPSVAPVQQALAEMLRAMVDIGLGYLSLSRASGTLSGGESQRVKMVRHLGSALTDVTYVFDEPTVGLHPHDIARMNTLLGQLRNSGSTVLVVEHKPEVIDIADHVVDIGPGAGSDGGEVVYAGPRAGLEASGSVTGRLLDRRPTLRDPVREGTAYLEIRDARRNNLTGVDVDIPLGVLVAVTGVAGSGKSSLVHGSLTGREEVLVVDQSAIRGSRRSNPATYSGLLDPIRTAFAKENGVKAALFSPNSEGACPACSGYGVIYTELPGMPPVVTPCEACGGRRFQEEVLSYTLHGLAIDEVLRLSVAEAAEVFTTGKAATILRRLLDVGLPYLKLGQTLTSLSGGERQRLKLASQLRTSPVVVLDEPSSGLHLADTDTLLAMLHGLVDDGTSVIVIEHNLAVVSQADWIIDVGPGAGHEGGRIIFEGTPAQMVELGDTLTAQYLRERLGR
ncbi:excinuclease ABC subunit UvrA [Ornithinimicrobium sufpigmenti]|uniref:excinuclease ABC subunit UvrA n=1 Tax=Ornithinimicrobium sufpigmenti TaxID=2508882 RepID=UPI0010355321|nr:MULTISPECIES: excinuclease ABC subunit UvrA [unclassified Ornithinimicrobium]